MKEAHKEAILQAYTAFNARNIDQVLSLMNTDVHWPNGWEGGYVEGHEQVRDYWTRQWKEVNPVVEPVVITQLNDGSVEVQVHQLVKDMSGNVLFDGMIKHIYVFEDNLIKSMVID